MNLLKEKTKNKLAKVIEQFPGVMGIYAQDLTDPNDKFSFFQDEEFPVASIIKIPILIEFFKKVEAGELNPENLILLEKKDIVGGSGVIQFLTPRLARLPLKDYVTLMINVSDNTATNKMIDIIGITNVNTTLKELGLQKTRLQRKMQDKESIAEGKENISTPKEMTKLLQHLYTCEGLSSFVCKNSLSIMKKYKTSVLRDILPKGTLLADKYGEMDGVYSNIGIIFITGNPYALSIMTKHVPISDTNKLNVKKTIRKAASIIQDYFLEKSLSTEYGIRR